MSKKTVCRESCKCRKCKDRERRRAIKLGTHIPFIPKGRKADIEATAKRRVRTLRKCFEWLKRTVYLRKKALNAVRRKKKDWLFRLNRDRKGEKFAKLVCVCVRKKKNGQWYWTEKDKKHWEDVKMDRICFSTKENT